jgi:hypothetical protein
VRSSFAHRTLASSASRPVVLWGQQILPPSRAELGAKGIICALSDSEHRISPADTSRAHARHFSSLNQKISGWAREGKLLDSS